MRRQWTCPDLGLAREPGMYLPVDGTIEEFPDCPAAYLRTAGDIPMLEDRFGRAPFAAHLIDGAIHPASIVSTLAQEIESGARSVDSVSPRAMTLVHIWMREKAKAREKESELKRSRGGS